MANFCVSVLHQQFPHVFFFVSKNISLYSYILREKLFDDIYVYVYSEPAVGQYEFK